MNYQKSIYRKYVLSLLFSFVFILGLYYFLTFSASASTFTIQLKTGWNMFSIPVNKTLTQEQISNTCELESSIWYYNTLTKNYQKVSTLTPGVGYWIMVKKPCTITLEGTPLSTENLPELKPGWNQISALSESFSVPEIRGDCEFTRDTFRYNPASGQYEETDTLQPGSSYWVKVERECQLSAAPPQEEFDFSLSVDPLSGTVHRGSSVSTDVTATLLSGTTQAVTFSAKTSTPSITFNWDENACSPTSTRNLTINTTSFTPTGLYTISIEGTGGGLTRTTHFGLSVSEVPIDQCADGTPYNRCSSSRPKFCDNGSLINKCTQCDCPSGKLCNTTTGSCYTPSYNLEVNAFYNNNLVSAQVAIGLGDANWDGLINQGDLDVISAALDSKSGDPRWNIDCDMNLDGEISIHDMLIIAKNIDTAVPIKTTRFTHTLSAGTYTLRAKYSDQIQNKSVTISVGQVERLIFNFTPGGGNLCLNGTPSGQCSSSKPKYCDNGTLINKCTKCGCPSGQLCDISTQACYTPLEPSVEECSDGTPYGECSSDKPKFCYNGDLVDYCRVCGCSFNQLCNQETDKCYAPQACSDGTPYNHCSTNQPLFCNDSGVLTNSCQNCGCPAGEECKADGTCETNYCSTLKYSGDPDKKLDVVILGDKYDDLGMFASDVTTHLNTLLSYEPFTSMSNKINFYRVDRLSRLGCFFGGTHDIYGTEREILMCRNQTYNQREAAYCPHDQTLIIVNLNRRGGAASRVGNIGWATRGDPHTTVHEFGHSFGKLYDHYPIDPGCKEYKCLMCGVGFPFGSPPESKCDCLGQLIDKLNEYE